MILTEEHKQEIAEIAQWIFDNAEDISLEFGWRADDNGHPTVEDWVIEFILTWAEMETRIWANHDHICMNSLDEENPKYILLGDEQIGICSDLFKYGYFDEIAEKLNDLGVPITEDDE